MTPGQIKAFAVDRAKELGFVAAGVAAAGPAAHGEAFRQWLAAGHHASMEYMARHVDERCDLHRAWPWAKSVLCLAASYVPVDPTPSPVARYARGRDYHRVLKGLCRQLADGLAERVAGLQTRICVDTAAILEREWAAAAGLGWIGRNACLIHPTAGSYVLLAEILLSVELPPDSPIDDRCSDCQACVDACPNGALVAPRTLDSRRCNSWATIENRSSLDADALDPGGSIFGCDLCQQACPFNCDAPSGRIAELITPTPVAQADVLTILHWSAEDWDLATRGSATRRASYPMLLRNAAIAAGRLHVVDARRRLAELAEDADPIIRAAATWSLARLEANGR